MSTLHQGIDLSRFKKVSGDKNTSTLRHAKGHEIKVAHNGLTPKMYEQIKNMPVHMKDGGGAKIPKMGPSVPEQPADESADQTESSDQNDSAQETPPAAQPQNPAQPQQPPPGTPDMPNLPPDLTPQGKMQEYMSRQTDMANGHIHPQTYSEWYGKKDTPGKIGTLFGLLLSGAGSGLSHQSNALMDMMNKEIERDVQAQRDNIGNARSFLSQEYAHQLNDANIRDINMGIRGQYIDQGKNAAINSKIVGSQLGNNNGKDYLDTIDKMLVPVMATGTTGASLINGLANKVQNNPRGKILVKQLKDVWDNKTAQDIDKVHKEALTSPGMPDPNNRNRPITVSEDNLTKAKVAGLGLPAGMPGNLADKGDLQAQKAELMNLRENEQDYVDNLNELAGMGHAGEIPFGSSVMSALSKVPYVGEGLASTGQRAMERRRSELKDMWMKRLGLTDAQADSILPYWGDTGTSLAGAAKAGVQHFMNLESKTAPGLHSLQQEYKKKTGKDIIQERPNFPIKINGFDVDMGTGGNEENEKAWRMQENKDRPPLVVNIEGARRTK